MNRRSPPLILLVALCAWACQQSTRTGTGTARVPGAPTAVQAAAGIRSATISWTPPTDQGDSPVTGYQVTPYLGTRADSPVAVAANLSAAVIEGLADGTTYTFQVSALNAFGAGPAATSAAITTASTPGAPTGVVASTGDRQATVTWTAPLSGGSLITSYTVTSFAGSTAGAPVSVSGTQALVAGLADGTSYTFTVVATNAVGDSAPSAPSNAVTPSPAFTVPGAPVNVMAAPGIRSATVTWSPPESNGGSQITGYLVTPYAGTGPLSAVATASTRTIVTGLADGATYTFRVSALNSAGVGPAAVSMAIETAGLPGAPLAVTATPGNQQITIQWTAPADDGSPITGYAVTPWVEGTTAAPVLLAGTATQVTVTGLTNGTAYTFTVSASNAAGQGPPSVPSNSAIPFSSPNAPMDVVAVAGPDSATVTWVPPSDNGSPLTGYVISALEYSSVVTEVQAGGNATQVVVPGLAPATTYTFQVTAVNAGGDSAAAASNPVTTPDVPGPPTNVTAVAGDGQATVSWSAPASDGGANITGYLVEASAGGTTMSTAGTSVTVTGLTNDTSYTFTVIAINGAGDSAASQPSNAVMPLGPPSSTTSTLVVNPTTAQADGKTAITLAVTLKDAGGMALPQLPVSITVGGSWNRLAQPSGTTDATGTFTTTVTSTQAETKAVTATAATGTGPAFVLISSVAFTAVTCSGELSFAGIPADISLSEPIYVAQGDFNEDGKLDLAVAFDTSPATYQNTTDTLAILLGNGDGAFQPPSYYPAGGAPTAIVVADFNRDGKADLAVTGYIHAPSQADPNFEPSVVDILIGNGDGTFQPMASYVDDLDPISITVADFNGDGNTDIATGNGSGDPSLSSEAVTILLGKGDGTFEGERHLALGVYQTSIASGDFNHDGNMDLAVVSEYEKTYVFTGNGDGTFVSPIAYATDGFPVAVTVIDLNDDGNDDLLVGNRDSVTSFLGTGMGGFRNVGSVSTLSFGGLFGVLAGDFNGDGNADAALAVMENSSTDGTLKPGQIAPGVVILPGNGDGTLTIGPGYNFGAAETNGTEAESITAGDFDGDGTLDLAVSNLTSSVANGPINNIVSELLGNGDGTFFRHSQTYAVGSTPDAAIGGDFNEDGIPDIVVANGGSSDVSVLLGNENGTLGSATNYDVGLGPSSVASGDINGDGHLDLALGNAGGATVSILLGNGVAGFPTTVTVNVPSSTSGVALSDFNKDGKLDLAVSLSSTGQAGIWLGDGTGNFNSPALYAAGTSASALSVADFNGDGWEDLAVADNAAAQVSVLLNSGAGTLGTASPVTVGNDPDALAAGDFNADGNTDLAVANAGDGTVSVLLGTGEGQFQPAVSYAVGKRPGAVAASDMNADGKLDLVVSNTGEDEVSILYGNGDGTFQAAANFGIGRNPGALVIEPFLLNGYPDIAAVDTGDGNIGLLAGGCN